MNQSNEEDDAVGYGKPPKHSQFKKGQSGNPSGRRKNVKMFSDPNPVREILLEETQVKMKGRKRKMSKIKALIHRYWGMAMNGDYRAFAILMKYCGEMDLLQHWDEKRAVRRS